MDLYFRYISRYKRDLGGLIVNLSSLIRFTFKFVKKKASISGKEDV